MPILTLGNPLFLMGQLSNTIPTPTGGGMDLPDVYIRDSLTKENKPVGGILGWDGDYIQAMYISQAPLEFVKIVETDQVDGYTSSVWCNRVNKIVLSCVFELPTENASFRIVYVDKNGVPMVSSLITVNAINLESPVDTGYYMSELVVADSYGSNYFSIYIESISNGKIKIYGAGI